MFFSRLIIACTAVSCILPIATSAQAATSPAANAPITRAELPALVKETLMNEPEIIMEAVKKLRETQKEEAKQKAAKGLEKYKTDLFNDPKAPFVGAKDADIVIAEFFDYHCGYCKRMLPVIRQTIKEDKKVRFVFIEFPILSKDSVTAARASLAVNNIAKDKYFDFHKVLMTSSGKFDEKKLMETAKKIGIDTAKLKAEMEKPEITAILDKNREIAGALNISGTPAIVFGGEIAPGAVDYETLKKMIASVRAGKAPSEALKPTKDSKK